MIQFHNIIFFYLDNIKKAEILLPACKLTSSYSNKNASSVQSHVQLYKNIYL